MMNIPTPSEAAGTRPIDFQIARRGCRWRERKGQFTIAAVSNFLSGKFWPSPLLSLSSCINIECIVVLNNASTHKIRETFIRLLKKGKLPHRVNGPLRAPIICLNYAIEPKRLALYINTMLLLLLFLLLFLWLSSLLLLHWNNVIPYIFVGRLTDHTHNLKLE